MFWLNSGPWAFSLALSRNSQKKGVYPGRWLLAGQNRCLICHPVHRPGGGLGGWPRGLNFFTNVGQNIQTSVSRWGRGIDANRYLEVLGCWAKKVLRFWNKEPFSDVGYRKSYLRVAKDRGRDLGFEVEFSRARKRRHGTFHDNGHEFGTFLCREIPLNSTNLGGATGPLWAQ